MFDKLIFYYSIQLSFVFYLYKFHVCRIMQLCCSRKLEMYQETRTKLVLKFHKFLILFIVLREISYSSKNICYKCIFKNCHRINLPLKFKKVRSSAPKIPENFSEIFQRRASNANQTFFQLPPSPPIPHEFFVNTPENFASFLTYPWNFYMVFFLQYHPWKFHVLNPPVTCLDFFWNISLLMVCFGQ